MTYSEDSVYTGECNQEPGLNFELYSEQLCRIAIKATSSSKEAFTVGIFGSWGSGKTTLMKCIKDKLNKSEVIKQLFPETDKLGETKCKTIWVNPWKYDGKEDVRNALIQTILGEMANDPDIKGDKDKKGDPTKLKEIMDKALKLRLCTSKIMEQALKDGIKTWSLGFINPGHIKSEVEKAIRGEDNEAIIDPYQFINNFEETFKGLAKNYVGDNGRLIIFIDDLDRCLPENALAVLESIKLYLAQVNCVFFIGLDKRVIEQAVSQRYKDIRITGKEYVEKIIRLNFFLPDRDPDEVTEMFQQLPSIIGQHDVKIGKSDAQRPDNKDAENFWKMILDATKANLRKIEQFIIAFELIEKIVEGLNKKRSRNQPEPINWKENYRMFGKVLLLQMNFPEFYDVLEKNHALMDQIQQLYHGIKKEDDKTKPEPEKEDEDLKFKRVQEKYPFCHDHLLIKFIVDHFNYGRISSSEDWKIIHKLSKTVTGN